MFSVTLTCKKIKIQNKQKNNKSKNGKKLKKKANEYFQEIEFENINFNKIKFLFGKLDDIKDIFNNKDKKKINNNFTYKLKKKRIFKNLFQFIKKNRQIYRTCSLRVNMGCTNFLYNVELPFVAGDKSHKTMITFTS